MSKKIKMAIVLDELEIIFNWDDIFKVTIENINDSNTERASLIYSDRETGEYEKYTYMKHNIWGYESGYIFQYTYEGEVINAFSVLFWRKKGTVTTDNKITFYGSFLHEKWRDYIYNLIEHFFNTWNFEGLRRFDIACDIPESKKNIIESFKRKPKTELNYDAKKQEHETYYFWNRKNRTRLIRIYDKVLDTFKKWKWNLYNFTEKDNVTRIEVEFWKTAIDAMNENETYITYEFLLKNNILLKDLFLQSVIKSIGYFEEISYHDHEFSYPRRHTKNIKEHFMKFSQLPDWYQKNWFWLFKKIKDAIGFEWFFWYLFSETETVEWLDKFLKYYYKKKWGEKKIRAKKMSSDKFIKSVYDKDQLTSDIFDIIYNQKEINQDTVCLEIEKTLKKLYSRKIGTLEK